MYSKATCTEFHKLLITALYVYGKLLCDLCQAHKILNKYNGRENGKGWANRTPLWPKPVLPT